MVPAVDFGKAVPGHFVVTLLIFMDRLLPMHVLSAVVVLAVTLLSLPQDHPTVSHIWQHIANAQETLNIHSTSVNT